MCWIGRGAALQVDLTEQLTKQVTAKTPWTLSTEQVGRPPDFVLERGVDVDALFTDRWKLSEAVQAHEWFDRQSSGKGVIIP